MAMIDREATSYEELIGMVMVMKVWIGDDDSVVAERASVHRAGVNFFPPN